VLRQILKHFDKVIYDGKKAVKIAGDVSRKVDTLV
jgi:hypothetical protein